MLAGSPGMVPVGSPQAMPTIQDLRSTVNLQLSQGNFNEAFGTALSANNLSLVVATCEMVNPMQIFNQSPCPLSQHVLLSLIQQLGKRVFLRLLIRTCPD